MVRGLEDVAGLEPDEHDVKSATYEDGDPELCGQLTVVVQRIIGVEDDSIRPYCAVRAVGSDTKDHQTELTSTATSRASVDDTFVASWQTDKQAAGAAVAKGKTAAAAVAEPQITPKGEKFTYHINANHTSVIIDVVSTHTCWSVY